MTRMEDDSRTRESGLPPGTRRPPVLPVVIHNGESPWSAPVQACATDGPSEP